MKQLPNYNAFNDSSSFPADQKSKSSSQSRLFMITVTLGDSQQYQMFSYLKFSSGPRQTQYFSLKQQSG